MVKPLSEHARLVLEFINLHPGVQAKVIAAELNIKVKDLAIALTVLQGRDLVEARLDHKFDKRKHADDSAIRYFAKL